MKNNIKLYTLKKLQSKFPQTILTGSQSASDFIKQFYTGDIEIFESFFILMLNNTNKTIGYAKISQGGISGTIIDVRIIAKYAINCLATSVILAHNHPSGKLQPSQADKDITKQIYEGLKLLDIKVLDHIIVTNDGYFSFSDNNLMNY